MKFLLLVALAAVASANAGQVVVPEHDYMYIPGEDGNVYLVDLSEKGEDLTGYDSGDSVLTRNVDRITFHLLTRKNPDEGQQLVLNSISSVESSNFDSSRPTRFVTHGWRGDRLGSSVSKIRKAYLDTGDYNVIEIDWSSIANSLYVSAAPSVRGVAARVAEMIDFLHENAGLDLGNTKLIGFSLGAHVSGIAAHNVNGNIEAVVGLDPALPLFNSAGAGRRIHQTDADHVQIIHTNGGFLGIMDAIGDSDFYPNGGSRQPGCGIDVVGSCAHSRAYQYFTESIRNTTGFRATGIHSRYIDYMDRTSEVFMGGKELNTNVQGSFFLETARSAPFALG